MRTRLQQKCHCERGVAIPLQKERSSGSEIARSFRNPAALLPLANRVGMSARPTTTVQTR